MDQSIDLQQYLFGQIKSKLPPTHSLVDEIADLLSVSNDSAYRRIRGEKLLDIQETVKLCRHFSISVDALLGLDASTISFRYNSVDHENFHFFTYLQYVQDQLSLINTFEQKELLFAAKDIPFFHYFQFSGLTYFKAYFWMKLILNYPEYQNKSFNLKDAPDEVLTPARNIWDKYMKTPSVEIWSDETINVTLSQIEYCHDCGLFENIDQAMILLDEMKQMMQHIERQASLGNKFKQGSEATREGEDFNLYYNEVTISDNTILFDMNGQYSTYITHNMFNILTTTNPVFSDKTKNYFDMIISKSILLSGVSEKERSKFFRNGIKKIDQLADRLN